jgi:hypothetical protein
MSVDSKILSLSQEEENVFDNLKGSNSVLDERAKKIYRAVLTKNVFEEKLGDDREEQYILSWAHTVLTPHIKILTKKSEDKSEKRNLDKLKKASNLVPTAGEIIKRIPPLDKFKNLVSSVTTFFTNVENYREIDSQTTEKIRRLLFYMIKKTKSLCERNPGKALLYAPYSGLYKDKVQTVLNPYEKSTVLSEIEKLLNPQEKSYKNFFPKITLEKLKGLGESKSSKKKKLEEYKDLQVKAQGAKEEAKKAQTNEKNAKKSHQELHFEKKWWWYICLWILIREYIKYRIDKKMLEQSHINAVSLREEAEAKANEATNAVEKFESKNSKLILAWQEKINKKEEKERKSEEKAAGKKRKKAEKGNAIRNEANTGNRKRKKFFSFFKKKKNPPKKKTELSYHDESFYTDMAKCLYGSTTFFRKRPGEHEKRRKEIKKKQKIGC